MHGGNADPTFTSSAILRRRLSQLYSRAGHLRIMVRVGDPTGAKRKL